MLLRNQMLNNMFWFCQFGYWCIRIICLCDLFTDKDSSQKKIIIQSWWVGWINGSTVRFRSAGWWNTWDETCYIWDVSSNGTIISLKTINLTWEKNANVYTLKLEVRNKQDRNTSLYKPSQHMTPDSTLSTGGPTSFPKTNPEKTHLFLFKGNSGKNSIP